MFSLTILSLFSAAFLGSHAQTIQVGNVVFDVAGCASPSGTNQCYQQASAALQQGAQACNSTGAGRNCLAGSQLSFDRDLVGCLTEGCWNRALSCEYQYILASYDFAVIHQDSVGNNPPFTGQDYENTPGSCGKSPENHTIANTGLTHVCDSVCNIPLVEQITFTPDTSLCPVDGNCYCCLAAAEFGDLQRNCPNNSLRDLALFDSYIQEHVQYAQQHCPGLQQNNWLDLLEQSCPNYNINPSVSPGYVNLLSIPTNFPTTGPIPTNIPGSVTALAQLNITGSTTVHNWGDGTTSTYTFSSYNAAAAASGGSAAQVTTLPPITTTINGQATTIAASVVTASHSGAERIVSPAIGLFVAFMVMLTL